MARDTGVVLMSLRPTAEVPISTSLPAIISGATFFFQHIDRRNIDRRIVAGKMNPELAVVVGRNLKALDADALDAGLVGLDQDRVGAGGDPQHLELSDGMVCALRLHDHRHPPHDAVAFGLDREQAAPGGRLLQHRHVAQQAREIRT